MLVVATDPLSFYRAHLLTDRHLPEHIPALLEAELRLRQLQERSGIPALERVRLPPLWDTRRLTQDADAE